MSDQNTTVEKLHEERSSNRVPSCSTDRVRNILALVTVIGFVLITAVLAIVFPLFALASPDKMIVYLKDLSSIYSGIVGLVIGYYFGKP
jgi:hypothetical protein